MANAFTLFGEIKLDTNSFTSGLKKAQTELVGTTAAMTKAESAAAKTSAGLGAMKSSFLLLGAGALAAGAGIFKLMKSTADYGSKIFDATKKTGMSAETMSALKFAAEQSGASFEQATKAITKFSLLMGESADGSEKAAASLRNLGVSSTDLETGFAQALATISKLPPGIAQTEAASAAFGKRLGAELLPMIDSFKGDLPALMAELQKSGLLMSGPAAKAADDYADTMDKLDRQVTSVARSFALELMPSVTSALKTISDEMAKSDQNWEEVGKGFGKKLGKGIAEGIKPGFEETNPDRIDIKIDKFFQGLGDGLWEAAGIDQSFQGLWDALKSANTKFSMWGATMVKSFVDKLGGLGPAIMTFINPLGAAASALGRSVGEGFVKGIQAKYEEVKSSIAVMAGNAIATMQGLLRINSPSLVFMEIGQFVGEGFALGITRSTGKVLDAIKGQIKEIYKATADLLLDNAKTEGGYAKTINAQTQLAGLEKAKQQLSDLIALRIEMNTNIDKPLIAGKGAEQEITRLTAIKERMDGILSAFKEAEAAAMKADPLAALISYFGNPEAIKLIEKQSAALGIQVALFEKLALLRAFGNIARDDSEVGAGSGRTPTTETGALGPSKEEADKAAKLSQEMERIRDGVPPLINLWASFWEGMKAGLASFQASLPSLKQALGENLISSIQGIGDVFANAVMQWDGTAKGFFKSLASGFKQLVSQIVAELVRLMVIKAIMQIIGAVAGGAGGGSSAASSGLGGGLLAGLGGGNAQGGYISGPGSGTSDSILARLSNGEFVMSAKAVKKWGAGFFEGLNSLTSPQMAFASGGYVGGGGSMSNVSNNTSHANYNVVVNMPSTSGSNGATADQVQRAVLSALHKTQTRNK